MSLGAMIVGWLPPLGSGHSGFGCGTARAVAALWILPRVRISGEGLVGSLSLM
jgi:hypothetical protein